MVLKMDTSGFIYEEMARGETALWTNRRRIDLVRVQYGVLMGAAWNVGETVSGLHA